MNRDLVEGARQVAESKYAGDLVKAEGLTAVAGHLSEGLSKVFQERNKEFNNIMNSTLNSNQGMSPEMYSNLYDKFQRMRGEFVYLNKKDRAMMMSKLGEFSNGLEQNENFKTELAGELGDKNVIGDNPVEDLGEETATDLQNIVSGSSEPIIIDGQAGHLMNDTEGNQYAGLTFSQAFAKHRKSQIAIHGMDYSKWTNFMWAGSKSYKPDGKMTEYHPFTEGDQEEGAPKTGNPYDGKKWVSNTEIKGIVDDNKVDTDSQSTMTSLLEGITNEASNLKPGDNPNFNAEKYTNLIQNNIINKGKLKSLAKDKIFGDRSFKKDLKEAIQTSTYQELGIPKEIIEKLDPTDNGKITRRDSRRITRRILNDEELLKTYLTDYYVKALEQNFNSNVSNEVRNYTPPKKETDSNEERPFGDVETGPDVMKNFKEEMDLQGGDIDEDGVYTPGKSTALEDALAETRTESTILPFVKQYLPEGYSADEAMIGFDYVKIKGPDGRSIKIFLEEDHPLSKTPEGIVKQIDDFIANQA